MIDYKTLGITFGLVSIPFLQAMPDPEFLQGFEKVGIVGFLSAVLIYFVWERRLFLTKGSGKITAMEERLSSLENNVSMGDERIVKLLDEQLETLKEIKAGQDENFNRMWALAMSNIKPKDKEKPKIEQPPH